MLYQMVIDLAEINKSCDRPYNYVWYLTHDIYIYSGIVSTRVHAYFRGTSYETKYSVHVNLVP